MSDLLVDGISGAITGAIAATGWGITSQIVAGAATGFFSSLASDALQGKEFNYTRALNSAAAGGFASFLGGNGLGATQSSLGIKQVINMLGKQGVRSFVKSSLTSSISMFAYDRVNGLQ